MTREELKRIVEGWLAAWDAYDLDGVVSLFADDAVFETWTGTAIRGRDNIRRAWKGWFDAGGFSFKGEALVIDGESGTVVFQWMYEGPAKRFGGRTEKRRGIDLIRFEDGKIKEKITYTKTAVEVEGKKITLTYGEDG